MRMCNSSTRFLAEKSKKISLNEFLGDSTLGSWADEMESLPNAPAARIDEESSGDRYGRRGDDFASSRPDRQHAPAREDLPLPTQPPYTAFVGNLAFDLTEGELEDFFTGIQTKSVKIIKDKDDKPKGFGYVEFEELDGLKDALSKSGSSFSGRVVRISVAEPPKERGFGSSGAGDDQAKFDNPWRRDGPLPDLRPSRDSSRRRFDGPPPDRQAASISDGPEDWRSSRPPRASEPEAPPFKRKGSGFSTQEHSGHADREEAWTIGSRFKASSNGGADENFSRFGTSRSKGEMGHPKETAVDEGDWRGSKKGPARSSVSPSSSTPPTPQLTRRKLELLPRTGNTSVTPSPLSSPKMGPTPPTSGTTRSNPFGAARPVDVSSREKEVAERLERDRGAQQEKLSMSRTSSRTGMDRSANPRAHTPPYGGNTGTKPAPAKAAGPSLAPNVRPTLSFANAAAKKERKAEDSGIEEVTEGVANVAV